MICISSTLVVFSIDFTATRVLEVMGELACFKGLKFKMAVRILCEILGRARISTESALSVASTSTASLM